MLVLSLFPGIGLLDMAFEEQGFCVVRGPDVLWGGDIRRFHPPAGKFDGVIGGPPCQAFSVLARIARAKGLEPRFGNLIPEFERCVQEAQPTWFLMENVPQAPLPVVPGYIVRDLVLNNRWLGEEQMRTRRFSFGTRDGRRLSVEVALFEAPIIEYAVMASRGACAGLNYDNNGKPRPRQTIEKRLATAQRSWARDCELQGLPPDFLSDAPFTCEGKHRMLGNGVPLPMGRAIAKAVRAALEQEPRR